MLNFNTRKLARDFARRRTNYTLVDNGSEAKKRWAVKVLG